MTDFPEIPAADSTEDAPLPTPQAESGLEVGMKAMPVMVYTPTRVTWGEVHINENLRVGLVLQSTIVPDYISLYNAKLINLDSAGTPEQIAASEMHIPTQEIIGFHLMPSHTEPIDYDEAEPNRMMQPLIAMVGKFTFQGHVRMSTQTTIKKFVEVTRADFLTMYDLEIMQVGKPNQQAMKVGAAQVRRNTTIFTLPN